MSLMIDQLHASNEYLNLLLNSLNAGLFLVNDKIEVESFNDTFHALFQKPEDQIIGKLCGNAIGCIYTVKENALCGSTSNCDTCPLRKSILKTLQTKQSVYKTKLKREFFILGKTYQKYFLFTTHYISHENLNHVLIVLDDVTELENTNQHLTTLNKQKNELLGIAAHDLRNPIATIQMYSSFLQNAPKEVLLSNQGKELVSTIQDTSQFMLRLLEDVLNVSSIESGRVSIKKEKLDFFHFLREKIRNQETIALKKHIQFALLIPAVNCEMEFDPVKMEQVVNNLLSNAVKYSPPNTTITIKAEIHDNGCGVHVIDQGIGIPSGEEECLFKPFSRTSNKPTNSEKSTGLGLYLSKQIIEKHQGIIEYKRNIPNGSDFFFILPISSNGS